MDRLLSTFSRKSPKFRSTFFKFWYQFLARVYRKDDWKFMNYGYAHLGDHNKVINLSEADEEFRYTIQLYDHLAGALDLSGKKVLEIGCGRGGGADYVKRYLNPEIMLGVDLSKNVVKLCNQKFDVEGLYFEEGNAESLPFPDNSFDVVLNIESSHCYSSTNAFLAQVKRVLREDGYFLMADFRRREAVDDLLEALRGSGLALLKETDITQNIIEALDLDSERKTDLIK